MNGEEIIVITLDDAALEDALAGHRKTRMDLRAGDLQFDRDHYQRNPNHEKVTRIGHHWDELGEGTMFVSRREDGSYWVFDGQHRILGKIRRFGADVKVPCEVYQGLSIEEEARAFAILNCERGPVSAQKRYRAMLRAGHPEVVAINGILNEMSITASFTGGHTNRTANCWAALHDLLRQGGADHLREVLKLIDASWECAHVALSAQFLKGVGLLFRLHRRDPSWNPAVAETNFAGVPATQIDQRGKEIRNGAASPKPSAHEAVYLALRERYNRGRRTHRLMDVPRKKQS